MSHFYFIDMEKVEVDGDALKPQTISYRELL